MISIGVWQVMGRTLPVSLYQPKPDPLQDILACHTSENTLVLKEIPASVNDEYLATHIELVTGLSDDTDYKLDRRGDTALIQLNKGKFRVLEFYNISLFRDTASLVELCMQCVYFRRYGLMHGDMSVLFKLRCTLQF